MCNVCDSQLLVLHSHYKPKGFHDAAIPHTFPPPPVVDMLWPPLLLTNLAVIHRSTAPTTEPRLGRQPQSHVALAAQGGCHQIVQLSATCDTSTRSTNLTVVSQQSKQEASGCGPEMVPFNKRQSKMVS